MLESVGLIVFSYLLGSIPTGVIVSRLLGKDPRQEGSGNIGATNVMRTAGKGAGAATLLGDMAKGAIPVFLVSRVSADPALISLAASAAFLGHLYPVFLGFKGGKGVATAAGTFLVLSPLSFLLAALLFVAVVLRTRYVSLASLSAGGIMPLLISLFSQSKAYIILAIFMAIFILYRHRDNIQRLIEGRENQVQL